MSLWGMQFTRPAGLKNALTTGYPSLVRCFGLLPLYGLTIGLVASCGNFAGPEYKRPEIPIKEEWSQSQGVEVSAADTIRPDWWTGFGDPYLDELIQRSVEGNIDLKIQVAAIELAEANIKEANAQGKPTLGIGVQRQTQVTVGEGRSAQNPFADAEKGTARTNQLQLTGLNWDLDIWGSLKKGVNAQKASYKAEEWEWRSVYLSTVSAVASQYFLVRQLDEQIQKQQQAQENNVKLLNIYEAQLKEGLVAESEVLRQKAEIASLTQQLEDLRRERQVTTLRLATLLGIPAGDLVIPQAPLTNTVKEIDVPAGLPSDLLKRRPDIIAREYQVLAAHELLGQAKLAKLPSISLTGSANATGGASAALSKLLKTWTFGIGPNINIPIFDPNTKVRIKQTEARAKSAEENYRKTVITAFEQVEVALTNLASRKRQKKVLEEQIEHLSVVRDVQYAQLKEGLVSQLQVFDTDRQLLAAQLAKLRTHQQILSDTVTLYNALGGGWSADNVGQTEL